MTNKELNAKRYEIIFLERELLEAYYDVANLVSTNQDQGPKYDQAINKLKDLYSNEQLYFLTLASGDLDTLKQLRDSFDGIDEDKVLVELHDKHNEAIYTRVYNQLARTYDKVIVETKIRQNLPEDEEIEPSTLWEYISTEALFYEYYDILYKEQAGIYCTFEKISAIYELVQKDLSNEIPTLTREIFRTAFSNSQVTEEFLERLSGKDFHSITEEEISQDCEILLGEIFSLKDVLHSSMDKEMERLIDQFKDLDNDLQREIIMSQISHIAEYLDYETLEIFKQDMEQLAPELLPIIEHEMSIRNTYVHGKGECFQDYNVPVEEQNSIIVDLIKSSTNLLKLYQDAAYYETIGAKESEKFLTLLTKIKLEQANEDNLIQEIIDADLIEYFQQVLRTQEFETHIKQIKDQDPDFSLTKDDAYVVNQRLKILFDTNEYYPYSCYGDELFNDGMIEDFLKKGYTLDYYSDTDIYFQILNIILVKAVDNLISNNPDKPYFVYQKYNDLYTCPEMDQIVLESHFDSDKMDEVDENFLYLIAQVEEINPNFFTNTVIDFIGDYAAKQKAIIENNDESLDPNYLIYLNTKIQALTESYPNKPVINSQKTYKSEN